MSDELDGMFREVSAIMGEHTCEEIISGIWEHTFTPPCPQCEREQEHPITTKHAIDAYLQPAIEQMEQRRIKWLEEYQQWSKDSLLKRLEELSQPMDMMSYLRHSYDIKIEIPPIRLRPLLAEGTPVRKWRRKVNARNRVRRQHRAAFRRRKRGLA